MPPAIPTYCPVGFCSGCFALVRRSVFLWYLAIALTGSLGTGLIYRTALAL